MVPQTRIAAYCGTAGIVTFYGSLLSAVAFSPSFRWTTGAISDLGAVGADHAWMYNGGLVLGGLFSLAFAYGVFTSSVHWVEYVGAASVAVAYLLAILAGVFPYPTPLHDPVALVQFLLIPVGLWVYGAGNLLRGASRLGAATLGLGILAFGGVLWLLAVAATGSAAFALPELAVVVPFDAWAAMTIWRLY